MRTFGIVILISLLPLSLQTQREQKYQELSARYIDVDEAEQLINILKTAPESPIGFQNIEGSPLTITQALFKKVKRQQSGHSTSDSIPIDEYLMEEKISLVNTTEKRTKIVSLQFRDDNEHKEIAFGEWATIEPYGSYVFGERKKTAIEYKSLPVDPSRFTVSVLEVHFEDGTVWGMHPPYKETIKVDVKPVPIGLPKPDYTEEARRNKIGGFVRMRLLVGADGEVKQVKMIQGLPDGLNEEAVKEAYNLRFKPAMKDGQSVEYWLLYEIEFDPRQKVN